MRRKNQQEESLYFAHQYDVFLVANEETMLEDQNAVLDQINEDHEEINEEFDEVYKILTPNLSFFSGINYESWATKMKKILWLVDLLHYDHEGHVNSMIREEVK